MPDGVNMNVGVTAGAPPTIFVHAAFRSLELGQRMSQYTVHGYFPPSLAEVETVASSTSLVLEDLTRWALSLHNFNVLPEQESLEWGLKCGHPPHP